MESLAQCLSSDKARLQKQPVGGVLKSPTDQLPFEVMAQSAGKNLSV